MKYAKIALAISLFALGMLALNLISTPPLKAGVATQRTVVTFSAPVEIPGRVLGAGTYVFKVLDFENPNIVQIFNKDQNKLFATILAIPDYRLKPTGKTVITFEERAAGSPPAIQAWFYPGMEFGHEFVYPKPRAMELAKLTNKPVPSMPANLEANTKMPAKSLKEPQVQALSQAHVMAEKPSGEEVEVGEVFEPPPASAQTPAAQAPEQPSKLPATASDLPLVALLGVMLIGVGFSLRLAAKGLR